MQTKETIVLFSVSDGVMYLCIFRIPVVIPYLLLSSAYLLKRLRFLHEKMYKLSYSQERGLCSKLKLLMDDTILSPFQKYFSHIWTMAG